MTRLMHLTRRRLLQLLASTGLTAFAPGMIGAQTADARAIVMVIDGIGPETPDLHLTEVLNVLLENAVPFGLVMPDACTDLAAALLRRLLSGFPDLAEPVIRAPGLAAMHPYFQCRAAAEKQALAERALGQTINPLTLLTDADQVGSFDALRALGFRNVLVPGGRAAARSDACAARTVCLVGGGQVALAEADAAGVFAAALSDPKMVQITLSLDRISALPVAGVALRIADILRILVDAVQSDRNFLTLPRAHLRWFGDDIRSRSCALRLSPAAENDVGYQALRQTLDAAGLPYSVTGPAQSEPDCLDPAIGHAAVDWLAGVPSGTPACATGALTGLDVVIGQRHAGTPVFDDQGRLYLAEGLVIAGTTAPDAIATLDSDHDLFITVAPSAWATEPARNATIGLIRQIATLSDTGLHDVAGHLAAIRAPDPVLALWQETRRALPSPGVAPETEDEKQALLADAAQAWRYIAATTDPVTGLCPATLQSTPGSEFSYLELTMWDIACHIQGLLAAHDLALIDAGDLTDRMSAILRALPRQRIAGLMLPSAVISTTTAQTLSADFNACDTGRLLAALRDVNGHPATKGMTTDIVAGWDLPGVIRDDRIHSITNGSFDDASGSHCSHYTARAFRMWGMTATSPYEMGTEGSATDTAMRLLYRVADIGAYGAEPLLFETLEMGASPPAAILTDVLFAAQVRAHREKGGLWCVSEAPLDRSPWFAYHGLRVADAETRFEARAMSDNPNHQTAAFQAAIMLVNSKAAYLWSAVRPDPYSSALVAHIRNRAPIAEGGFSPGVYAQTGLAMPGYSDLNTNGVILQAVAHILRGRKPRA
jgi:Protein of unknown function (DUF3131)